MKRSAFVLVMTMAAVVLPARLAAAAGPVASIDVFPTVDTKEVGKTITVEATARAADGTPLAGHVIDFMVFAGPHAGVDLDGAGATPLGHAGSCTTDAAGTCSRTYTGSIAGLDTLTVWEDLNADDIVDPGEVDAAADIQWVATSAGTRTIRTDVDVFCDGDDVKPIAEQTWNSSGPARRVTETFPVAICALRFSSADDVTAGPVMFTITGGPGQFSSGDGAVLFGSTVTVDQGFAQYATAFLLPTKTAGTTSITATAEGITATAKQVWLPGLGRTIAIAAPATGAAGGFVDLTVTATDAFGNLVPGEKVTLNESGPGRFAGGASSIEVTTGPDGTATARLVTNAGETGTQTVTASLDPAGECTRLAGDPAGAVDGVCNAAAAIAWATGITVLTAGLDPLLGVWGTRFAISGTLASGGAPVVGRTVTIQARLSNAPTFHTIGTPTTDSAGRYTFTDVPKFNTQYRAVFAGDPSYLPSAAETTIAGVRFGVALNIAPTFQRRFAPVWLSGTVLPARPGGKVYLQELQNGIWVTVGFRRLDVNSSYRFGVTRITPGTAFYRVAAESDAINVWNLSRVVSAFFA